MGRLDKEPQYEHRKLVCGVGVFDAPYAKTRDKLTRKAYRDWNNMLQRCYGKSNFPSKPAYKECVVCEEWYSFLKFREWFDENYIEGYFLDKDIRYVGNKVYSPQTCCYIPPFINTLLLSSRSSRGECPIGVTKRHNGKYVAQMRKYGKLQFLGIYLTKDDAFYVYKQAKEEYIKEVAQEYFNKGEIDKRVYDALMNYKVEITD